MMDILMDYIVDQAFIVILVLLFIGKILKGTPKFKDWLIPYVLLVLGIIFAVFLMGFNVDAVIQGILVSGAAVFGHQLYTQGKRRDCGD